MLGEPCRKGATGDLLELYCGNGNFSLALARGFDRVLATENRQTVGGGGAVWLSPPTISATLQIIRMAAEEFTQAMNGVRQFQPAAGYRLHSYRCGSSSSIHRAASWTTKTEKMVRAYPRILYISCNPETLCRNTWKR